MERKLDRDKYLSFFEASVIAEQSEIDAALAVALNENSEIPEDFSCNICMMLI